MGFCTNTSTGVCHVASRNVALFSHVFFPSRAIQLIYCNEQPIPRLRESSFVMNSRCRASGSAITRVKSTHFFVIRATSGTTIAFLIFDKKLRVIDICIICTSSHCAVETTQPPLPLFSLVHAGKTTGYPGSVFGFCHAAPHRADRPLRRGRIVGTRSATMLVDNCF